MQLSDDADCMEILEEHTHRLLAYVEAARAGGHRLQRRELDAFAEQPERRVGEMTMWALSSPYASRSLGVRRWAESATDWFERLGWVAESPGEGGGVVLTSLGRALLKSLSRPHPTTSEDEAIEVFLDPSDPMSYVRFIGALSDLGEEVFLVDPYFRFPQLDDLMGSSVTRVLTSTKIKPQAIAHLELALGVLPPGEGPEIKTVSNLHDRFAMSQEGRVIALGSSIGSSRQNIGAVVELHGRASEAIREAHEALWADATSVTPRVSADGSSAPTLPQVSGDE